MSPTTIAKNLRERSGSRGFVSAEGYLENR